MASTIDCIITFNTAYARKNMPIIQKNTYVFKCLILHFKKKATIVQWVKDNKQIIFSCFFNKIFFVFSNFQNELYHDI